ncbi:MAG: DEAD/DEAH box helicase [Eubacterium sp.]|jgi:helicase domain protein|nr:DEAD/DEAH box helicase [Eubacterium sp.]
MEKNLHKENTLVLDYLDNQLVLYANIDDISVLTNKMFFKSKIKHKVDSIENNVIYFNIDLVYPDFVRINNILEKKAKMLECEYYATERLKDYINERNLYIDKRAKLGIELKTDDANLQDRYSQFKEIVDNQMERQLRDKQMKDAFFMCAMMRSGNFSVPGSGKTSSALAVFSFLKYRDLVDRVVMIGPKNAFGSWIDEFQACFGDKMQLDYFSIQDGSYNRPEDKRYALKFDTGNCNLFLFNYESVANYVEEISDIVSKRTLLVFDEVHKVKAINGQRATAALEVAKSAVYTIAMTGTPIPNTYLDLYNLLHILYPYEYKEFFGFDTSYLRDPFPTDIDIINKKIQPFFCRTTKKELQVPDVNPDIISRIKVTANEQKLFEIIAKKYQKNKLALFIRMLQMESNPKMLLQKIDLKDFSSVLDLQTDINLIDFVDYANEVKTLIEDIGITSKKKECLSLTEKLVNENKKVVIWCIFVDSIRSIKASLESMGIKAECIMGEVALEDRIALTNAFKDGKYDVLITNPHTLAESVSLHHVCHDAIYYEYSYNLVHLLQSKDRIHRLGLKEGQYTQYYYMQAVFKNQFLDEFSMDEEVYLRLKDKEEIMLKAIDDNELEPVYTPEQDLELIFKNLF